MISPCHCPPEPQPWTTTAHPPRISAVLPIPPWERPGPELTSCLRSLSRSPVAGLEDWKVLRHGQ